MKHVLSALRLSTLSVILDVLCMTKRTASYSAVAGLLHMHHHDLSFFSMLGTLVEEDAKAGKPIRSSLVVAKKTLRPGDDFFKVAVRVGLLSEKDAQDPIKQETFWRDQLQDLGVPVPEQLLEVGGELNVSPQEVGEDENYQDFLDAVQEGKAVLLSDIEESSGHLQVIARARPQEKEVWIAEWWYSNGHWRSTSLIVLPYSSVPALGSYLKAIL